MLCTKYVIKSWLALKMLQHLPSTTILWRVKLLLDNTPVHKLILFPVILWKIMELEFYHIHSTVYTYHLIFFDWKFFLKKRRTDAELIVTVPWKSCFPVSFGIYKYDVISDVIESIQTLFGTSRNPHVYIDIFIFSRITV